MFTIGTFLLLSSMLALTSLAIPERRRIQITPFLYSDAPHSLDGADDGAAVNSAWVKNSF